VPRSLVRTVQRAEDAGHLEVVGHAAMVRGERAETRSTAAAVSRRVGPVARLRPAIPVPARTSTGLGFEGEACLGDERPDEGRPVLDELESRRSARHQ
jgi:hypothetical protein